MDGNAAAIELRGLVKDYGAVRALDGLSLRVERGDIFGFLGPNGAGKTTAIRCLLGLIRPTAGQALVLGIDCQQRSVEARAHLGYLPGDLRLYETLTGQQTTDYFASLRATRPDPAYLGALLDRFDFDPSRRVETYSKGNKQKLGLILAMMHEPDVLVLDEPTSGLDPLMQEEVQSLLEEVAAAGRAVFFSSHVLSEAEQMCNRVAFIRQGKLVAVEEVAALKGRSLHLIEVTFGAPVPAGAFAVSGVREVERRGRVVHLEVRDNLDAVLKTIARYPVIDLRTEQPSLEQIFIAYYQTAPQEPSRPAEGGAELVAQRLP